MPDYVNIRIWKDTRRLLRLIAAATGEQMVQVMDRLCQEEMVKRGLHTPAQPAAEPHR